MQLKTSMQIRNIQSAKAVAQDQLEPSKKVKNKNNTSVYHDLDMQHEENNFVWLKGPRSAKEYRATVADIVAPSLFEKDKYERHKDRRLMSDEDYQYCGIMALKNYRKRHKEYQRLSLDNKKLQLAFSKSESGKANLKYLQNERILQNAEKKFGKNKVQQSRLPVQSMLFQIGTGAKTDKHDAFNPLTSEQHIEVYKETLKRLERLFPDYLHIISSVVHTKESIDHSQTLLYWTDDKGRNNAAQGMLDGCNRLRVEQGKEPLKTKREAFKWFVGAADNLQRQICKEKGYYSDFAERGTTGEHKPELTEIEQAAKSIRSQQLDINIQKAHQHKTETSQKTIALKTINMLEPSHKVEPERLSTEPQPISSDEGFYQHSIQPLQYLMDVARRVMQRLQEIKARFDEEDKIRDEINTAAYTEPEHNPEQVKQTRIKRQQRVQTEQHNVETKPKSEEYKKSYEKYKKKFDDLEL